MRHGLAGMAAALGACSLNVNYPPGFSCDADNACPAGQVCQDTRCVQVPACFVAIGAGDGHSCAIRKDGTAWCWGSNDFGQLGDSTTTDQTVPVAVSGTKLPRFQAIAGGDEHTCALGSDSSVWCWGHNNVGQLGNGSTSDFHTPVAVSNLSDATAIAVGAAHTCAIRADHSVVCWGANYAGQIGNGAFNDQSAPSPIDSLHGVTAIAAGGGATCAVDGNHQLWCWGDNQHGQLGDGTRTMHPTPNLVSLPDVVGTAVGDGFSCALSSPASGGKVTCFGQQGDGQLGAAVDPSFDHLMPVPVEFAGVAVSIVARTDSACLLDDQKRVWCWGDDENFQLADTTSGDRFVPVLTGYGEAEAVVTGGAHTCAMSLQGGVTCSGYNGHGQLGNGRRTSQGTPHAVPGIQNAVSVTAGAAQTCATLKDDTVSCWGANDEGDLGDGTWIPRAHPAPVAALTGVQRVAAGFSHACALTQTGTVACWGANNSGQLGDGTPYTRGYPASVPGLTGIAQLDAGGNTTCALAGGAVSCWGQGGSGQLGNGAKDDESSPVGVKMLMPGVLAVAVGAGHACAINADHTVSCWGAGGGGQLGDGNFTSTTVPVAVTGLGGVDQIVAAEGFTCAHTNPDGVWCWGSGFNGEIGIDGINQFGTPKHVTALSGIMKIDSGGSHSCAIKANGTLACWGASYSGEVGDGGYNIRATPVTVAMPNNATVVDVSAGEQHTCAVLGDGSVACWGDGRFGQLGDGILADQTPVAPMLPCP